jgi:PAS domain S-box-containing protein
MKLKWRLLLAALLVLSASGAWFAYQRSILTSRVYRIGFQDNPPVHASNGQGQPVGLTVDILTEAARRAGIQLQWVFSPAIPDESFRNGHIDLWPLLTIVPERRQSIHFSDPYGESEGTFIVLADSPFRRVQDLDGCVVAYNGAHIVRRILSPLIPRTTLRPIPSTADLLQAVCRGEAHAAYADESEAISAFVGGLGCSGQKLRVILAPETHRFLAIGSTFAAAPAADALREQITQMTDDGALADIASHRSYFTFRSMELNAKLLQARRWQRFLTAAALVSCAGLLTALWLILHIRRQRQRAVRAEAAFRTSEAYHQSLIGLLPDSLFVFNTDGSLRSSYPKGITPTIQQPSTRHFANIQRVIDTGEILAEEERVAPNLWLETRLIPVRNPTGAIDAVMGISRDITTRKTALLRLAEQEARLRKIIETTTAGYFRLDPDGCFVEVNQAWLHMHAMTDPSEILGRHYTATMTPADLAQLSPSLLGLPSDFPLTGDFARLCADGSTGYHSYSVHPILSGDTVTGIEGFLIDTTPQRLALEARRQSEQRYAALFNDMEEGVAIHRFVYDDHGQPVNYILLDVNPRYEQIVGLSAAQVANRLATDVYATPEPPYLAEFTTPDSTGHVLRFETYFPPMRRHFSIAVAPMGQGHFATIFTDITARKHFEEEHAKLEEQLRQSQKMESIGRLAGGVAHDFNNLLTVINGYAEMLLSAPIPKPHLSQIEQIARAGREAAKLTSQLLAFSRRQIIRPTLLDVSELVRETEPMLRRMIGEDIRFETNLSPSLAPVLADAGQLHQVLLNLAANARDAMPRGGRLLIETSNVVLDESYANTHAEATPGPCVLLAVTDSGEGMDDNTLQHLFEPFFTTKKKGEGTGLGLSTVYGIIRQNRGWIWAYSEPGKGASFKIYLPQSQGHGTPAPAAPLSPEFASGTETILLVEDLEPVRTLATLVLRDCGYRVIEASDGAEALLAARRHSGPIHLLLTDVVMPGMSGKELADRLLVERPITKVLFATGYTENVIVSRGVLKPGIRYLPKPFTPRVLAAKVRETLDQLD